MMIANSCVALLLSVALSAEKPAESPLFEAQAVIWRGKPATNMQWECDLVIRNVTEKAIEVPRSPVAFNETYYLDDHSSYICHNDCGTVPYPDAYITLAPGARCLWRLDISRIEELADKSFEVLISASFNAYVAREKKPCRVECIGRSYLGPTPHEWEMQKRGKHQREQLEKTTR
jgi:hypothetical protein